LRGYFLHTILFDFGDGIFFESTYLCLRNSNLVTNFDLCFSWQAQAKMYEAPQMRGNSQTLGHEFFDRLYPVAEDISDIGKGAILVGLTSLGAILFPPYQPAISAGGGNSSSKLGWGDDDKYKKKYNNNRSRSFGRGRR